MTNPDRRARRSGESWDRPRHRRLSRITIVKTLLNTLRAHIGYDDDVFLVHTDKSLTHNGRPKKCAQV
jgi:hypothetical protein